MILAKAIDTGWEEGIEKQNNIYLCWLLRGAWVQYTGGFGDEVVWEVI